MYVSQPHRAFKMTLIRQIGDSFASLAGESDVVLPERYLDLKR